MAELSNEELLTKLGAMPEQKEQAALTPRQERIIAGFEDIQRFVEEQGRVPVHGEERGIFERIYAARLDRIRRQEECRALLEKMDHQNLLAATGDEDICTGDDMDDEALLAKLGAGDKGSDDVTHLIHVKPRSEIQPAEETADRIRCADFEIFKPIFKTAKNELRQGTRNVSLFQDNAGVEAGDMFILSGQTVYIAEKGEIFITSKRHKDSRLRVIYDNGTESNILMRSLQRALNKDETARRLIKSEMDSLFTSKPGTEDEASGTIYVCRSRSDHPFVAKHRNIVHKIGVTTMKIERRIVNAETDPTFMMAGVEVVATYDLYRINRNKMEKLLHRLFDPVRLDIEIKDRFGTPVEPREWFCVPLDQIDKAVELIKNGSIVDYRYDKNEARLVLRD